MACATCAASRCCTSRCARLGSLRASAPWLEKASATCSDSGASGPGAGMFRRGRRVELQFQARDLVAQQQAALLQAPQRQVVVRQVERQAVDHVVHVCVFHAKFDQLPLNRVQVVIDLQTFCHGSEFIFAAMNAPEQAFRIAAATGLHRGDRAYQQDQVEVITHGRVPGCALGVVADGMGGKSGGRKAADQVMLTARQIFERYVPAKDDAATTLRQLVMESHLMIKLTALTAEEEPHSTLGGLPGGPDAGMCSRARRRLARLPLPRAGDGVAHASTIPSCSASSTRAGSPKKRH